MTKIVVYMPLTWQTIHSKVFKSFVSMITHPLPDVTIVPLIHTAFPIDYNRNDAVEKAIRIDEADLIMFCDADQVFQKDTIEKLLRLISDETPVVTGVYWKKKPPFAPVVGRYLDWDKDLEPKRKSLAAQGFVTVLDTQCLYYKPIQTFDTVQQVDAFGMGCVLVRADVFRSIEQPYFRYVSGYATGDYMYDNITEDMAFCAALKKAGIKVLCDPTVQAGHIVEKVIGGNESDGN